MWYGLSVAFIGKINSIDMLDKHVVPLTSSITTKEKQR